MRSTRVSPNQRTGCGADGSGSVPPGIVTAARLCAGALVLVLSGCAGTLGPAGPGGAPGSTAVEGSRASAGPAVPPPSSPEAGDRAGPSPQPAAAHPTPTHQASEPDADAGPPVIWNRLRAGFGLEIPDNPRVQREYQWYASHPEYLARVQERARPYLHFILDEVESRGLPHELVLLPVVESAFQPFAYSPGRAAGIWQFIPSTGQHYGLKQTWWYDGRRDIAAATRAALDYLTRLNGQFDGDWALALAAYNAGGGTVRSAITRNRRRGLPTDYWSLDLPRETEGYVPRLLGIARVFADPQAVGVELADIPDTPYLAEVDIGGQLDLATAAEMAGLDMEALYRLNPGYNRWATDPDGPHRLLLPLEKIEAFETRLAELAPDARLKWERYRIRPGDNLGAIASRHKTTVAVLSEVNGLKSNLIRAGAHLLIPVAARDLEHYALSQPMRSADRKAGSPGERKLTYVVQPGDTLWDIARANGVSYRKLAGWNAMAPSDMLHPGEDLVIWTDKPRQADTDARRYVVRRGDSLYEIAGRFGVSVDQLREWNAPLGKYLQPGQVLVLAKAAASPADTTGARVAALLETKPRSARSSVRYSVRKGDSLYTISRRFNVSIADLRRWNSLPGKYLQPGQKLKLYVDVTEQAAL